LGPPHSPSSTTPHTHNPRPTRQGFPRWRELHLGSNGTIFFHVPTSHPAPWPSPAPRSAKVVMLEPPSPASLRTQVIGNTRRVVVTRSARDHDATHLALEPSGISGLPNPAYCQVRTHQRTSDSSSPMRANLGPLFCFRYQAADRPVFTCSPSIHRTSQGWASDSPLACPPSHQASMSNREDESRDP